MSKAAKPAGGIRCEVCREVTDVTKFAVLSLPLTTVPTPPPMRRYVCSPLCLTVLATTLLRERAMGKAWGQW